jgi:hypothetical protein
MRPAAEAEIVEFVNRPDTLPRVLPGRGPIDSVNLNGFALTDGDGCVVFVDSGDGRFEVHYLGRVTMRAMRAALAEVFTSRGVRAIFGATPREFRAARMFNRALGCKPVGSSVDSAGRDCIDYTLERDAWVTSLKSRVGSSGP